MSLRFAGSVRAMSAAMRELNALFATEFDDPESYAAAPPGDAYLARSAGRKPDVIALTPPSDGRLSAGSSPMSSTSSSKSAAKSISTTSPSPRRTAGAGDRHRRLIADLQRLRRAGSAPG